MAKLTPMMEQYFDIKKQYPHCLVFFRLGDFYELFFDDALLASKELEIALTGRDCGQEQKAPMCGVPHHSADGYIARLIEKGHKVAICEQMDSPKEAKTIVRREVVRVVTPGTVTDPHMLDETKNSYIMCVYRHRDGVGLAICDITTGEFKTADIPKADLKSKEISDDNDADVFDKKLISEIARINPREIIINRADGIGDTLVNSLGIKPSQYSEWAFEPLMAEKKIIDHFKVQNLGGFGISENKLCICASGALLNYLGETAGNALKHITSIRYFSIEKYLILDVSSRRNLELTETLRDKSRKGTLLWVLDKTKTAMGARLIRKWIEQPLISVTDINRRLDAVAELKDDVLARAELREFLNAVYDIERLMSKISYQAACGRDMLMLKKSFEILPHIHALLKHFGSVLVKEMRTALDTLEDLRVLIGSTIGDDPPAGIREGGFIKDGYSRELDKLRDIKNNGSNWLLELERTEREKTGIKNLRIRYNKIFGYNIEITNSNKDNVPEHYIRRQTLSNCERFQTPELKRIEEEILNSDQRIAELEYDIFIELCGKIIAEAPRIRLTADVIAALDALQSYAEAAYRNNYARPEVDEGSRIDIREGRHPVIELTAGHGFVPNDTYLDRGDTRVAIITGPNMAGKSTYMRQTALIVLMAQIGCFIPADAGKIGIVDRIFTRVGASDDLATGQSTFMVEMNEVANILNNATESSLLILDEIGRGTSTFDGLSIAWSVLEYISQSIGARTLFATHYHELTELEGRVEGVKNYCITVAEDGEDVVFLRKIARGGADHSYGIYVAKLAGLPKSVIERSSTILGALSSADIVKRSPASALDLPASGDDNVEYGVKKKMPPKYKLILNELQQLDIDSLTPREALRKLYEFKENSKGIDDLE